MLNSQASISLRPVRSNLWYSTLSLGQAKQQENVVRVFRPAQGQANLKVRTATFILLCNKMQSRDTSIRNFYRYYFKYYDMKIRILKSVFLIFVSMMGSTCLIKGNETSYVKRDKYFCKKTTTDHSCHFNCCYAGSNNRHNFYFVCFS
jgi:hypothetical protein